MNNEVALLSKAVNRRNDVEWIVKSLGDGTQILFRFPNDCGVSVVRHSGSYGNASGLFEAAPILYNSAEWDSWEFIGLEFSLPGFANRDDVSGWLFAADVEEILNMVSAL